MFRDRKIAQIAAFFIAQSSGQKMSLLKLMKLLYIADRESIRKYGESISNDMAVSMPHGPVLSRTLDLINGFANSSPDGWAAYITDREENQVALAKPFNAEELDELNLAELRILESVWSKFGTMTQWDLRDWTHDRANCPEWVDPNGSSRPIPAAQIAQAVGYETENAKKIEAFIHDEQRIDDFFASL